MDFLSEIKPLYSLSGFVVGALVGMTGMGGGSLMTPALVLLFGIHPATAVGTDLLYAAITKSGGTVFHGIARTVDWRIVRLLATGSIPTTILTLLILANIGVNSDAARGLITYVLSVALLASAVALMFRDRFLALYSPELETAPSQRTAGLTIAMGALLGVLVSISSVGAGSLGVTALLLLYPRRPLPVIVGSDIAHAVPLTLLGGLGHLYLGSVDWSLLGSLLVGSIPGIFVGSVAAGRFPERILRFVMAVMFVLIGLRLLF